MTKTLHKELIEEAELNDTPYSPYYKDFKVGPNHIEFRARVFNIAVSKNVDGKLTVNVTQRNGGEMVGVNSEVLPFHAFIAIDDIIRNYHSKIHEVSHEKEHQKRLRARRQTFDIGLPILKDGQNK